MSDMDSTRGASGADGRTQAGPVLAPGVTVLPPDAVPVAGHAIDDLAWYEDGGHKAALGVWAAVAVLAYAAMQVFGWFADWPFVALVVGSVAYFGVRGAAEVLREFSRRSDGGGATGGDDDWDVG